MIFSLINQWYHRSKCSMLTAKQEVSPGMINCMCPETAFSLTPDSIQVCPISLQA